MSQVIYGVRLLANALADDLTEEESAEIREGIHRGLEAAAQGHIKPLAQAVAEARQRHEFSASWADAVYAERGYL